MKDIVSGRPSRADFAEIGRRLRVAREQYGFRTTTQLARLLRAGPQRVSNWENGVARPTIDMGEAIVRLMPGLTLDWLYLGRKGGLAFDVLMRLDAAMADEPGRESKSRAPAPPRRGTLKRKHRGA